MKFPIYYDCKYRFGYQRIEANSKEEAKEIAKKIIPGTGTWCEKRRDKCKFKILDS